MRSGDSSKKPAAETASTKVQNKDRDMGAALRTVYQKTVEEEIPDDLLDLLGKLD
ncbi:NepR family anti-sigma factor [Sphingomonas endolithica]|uniref:NepR family anti-sigma factor n=1 Tax=Sphingomonas endolithica TaxID=2972485 RepID=UPI0021B01F99|nr:NepR family anti-sigma factor [Sphingomonas sp. ZFBP2030]